MKKLCIAALFALIFLCGCGNDRNVPKIDEYTWSMTSVQSAEDNGKAIIVGDEADRISDEAVMELTCTAENGILTVTDSSSDMTYTGSYAVRSESVESFIYDITLDGEEGYAVSAMTTYMDGTQTPTLILSFAEYTLNFQTNE